MPMSHKHKLKSLGEDEGLLKPPLFICKRRSLSERARAHSGADAHRDSALDVHNLVSFEHPVYESQGWC